ncbi:Abi family protein [Eggerthellaceae bacterium 24-137]
MIENQLDVAARNRKPWLTPAQQVEHLKQKGVRFEKISEEDARTYLERNNNFFRIRSYRTNFEKVAEGARADQYVNLDFKMLIDLSIIDMLLRNELLPMTLDIEHFAKVNLLGEIERHGEDGYSIVEDFLAEADRTDSRGKIRNRTKDEIERGQSSAYTSGLLEKHPEHDYPVWVFMELVSFGAFLRFMKFCADRFGDKRLRDDYYLLQNVKALRNACAHNSCVLNNMIGCPARHNAQPAVTQGLESIGISLSQRRSKMKNEVFQQIATVLYAHQRWVSEGVRKNRGDSLRKFSNRMLKNWEFYKDNGQVVSGFFFILRLISGWYPDGNHAMQDGETLRETRGETVEEMGNCGAAGA